MTNPWLEIPWADYEGHMALPQVAQATLLGDIFERILHAHAPASVVILRCAGGNGFDRIDPQVTTRVIGIDINPAYVATARERFQQRLPGLDLIVADLQQDDVSIAPVDLVYAALLFEYVDVDTVLATVGHLLKSDGHLVTVVQLPNIDVPDVTPSPFISLQSLASCMRLVSPEFLSERATAKGFVPGESFLATTLTKAFQVQRWRSPRTGVVTAVCRDETHSFSKPVVDEIRLLAGLGVAGDSHCGATVQHRSRVAVDPRQPNLRQVHLLHAELHDELRAAGFRVSPGTMGENITTRGIELLTLPVGTALHVGDQAVVEVTGLRNPCTQLDAYQDGLMAAVLDRDAEGRLIRKAGIMGVVRCEGMIRRGDPIRVVLPPPPHRPLDRV